MNSLRFSFFDVRGFVSGSFWGLVLLVCSGVPLVAGDEIDWEEGFGMLVELGMPQVEGAELGIWAGQKSGLRREWSEVAEAWGYERWHHYPVWRWEDEAFWHFYAGGFQWSEEKGGESPSWTALEEIPEDFVQEMRSSLRRRPGLRGFLVLLGAQMHLQGWSEGIPLVEGLAEEFSLSRVLQDTWLLLPEGQYLGVVNEYVQTGEVEALVEGLEVLDEVWGEEWFAGPWLRKVLERARLTRDWRASGESSSENLPGSLFSLEEGEFPFLYPLSRLRKTYLAAPEDLPDALRPLGANPMEVFPPLLEDLHDRRLLPQMLGVRGQDGIPEGIEWAHFPRPDSVGWFLRGIFYGSLPMEYQEELEISMGEEEWQEALDWGRKVFAEEGTWEEYLWALLEGVPGRNHRVVLELLLRESETFDRERFERVWAQPFTGELMERWEPLRWSSFFTLYIQAFPDEQTARWVTKVEYPTDPEMADVVVQERHAGRALLAYLEEPTVDRLVTELLTEMEVGEEEGVEGSWLPSYLLGAVLQAWPAQEVLDVLVERLEVSMGEDDQASAEHLATTMLSVLWHNEGKEEYDFADRRSSWEKVLKAAERETYLAELPMHIAAREGFEEIFRSEEWRYLQHSPWVRKEAIAFALEIVRAAPGEDVAGALPEKGEDLAVEALEERLRALVEGEEPHRWEGLEEFTLPERLVLMRAFSGVEEEKWKPLGRALARVEVPSGGAAPEGLHGSFLGEETVLDLIRDKRARIESGSFGDQALVRGPLLETFHWQRWGGHSAEDLTDSSPKLEIMLRAFPVWAEEEPQWQTVSLAGLETLAKDFSREEWDEFLKKQNKVQEWEEFLRLYQRWVAGDPAFLNQLVMLHLSYYPD